MGGSATKEAVEVEVGSRRLRIRQHIADGGVGQIFLVQEVNPSATEDNIGQRPADYFALKRCLCPATADPFIHSIVQTEADFYVR